MQIKTILSFYPSRKIRKVIRLFLLMMMIFTIHSFAAITIQGKYVKIHESGISLSQMIKKIEKQVSAEFVYKSEDLKEYRNLKVDEEGTVENVFKAVLKNTDLKLQVSGDVYVISKKEPVVNQPVQQEKKILKGKVTDSNGEPLPGVTVFDNKSKVGTVTDSKGYYEITVLSENSIVVFSFIGMKTQEIRIGKKTQYDVVLEQDNAELGEVVVNGYFSRNKDSFTGNASVFSGEKLLSVGSNNIVKSLSVLDPAIRIVENNDMGSDPNAMLKIRLRGEAQFEVPDLDGVEKSDLVGDPNLPIFILDGFQTSVEKVMDLDMNRIESVTTLKDASASAIYGSRASNGVIVITTKKPESGELQITYNMNLDFSFPDLKSYDLLNAREKFELEKQLGLVQQGSNLPGDGYHAKERYNKIARWIGMGVDTDWMSQPLRNSVGQKHSLNIMGGDKYIRYGFDVAYLNRSGVMKGSGRENINLTSTLIYNYNDKVLFTNILSFDKNSSEQSPYGNFNNYVLMNPYLPIYDEKGNVIKGETGDYYSDRPVYNPIAEAHVGNYDRSKYSNITENFAIDVKFTKHLRYRGSVNYSYKQMNDKQFVSPNSSTFGSIGNNDPDSFKRRGRYSNDNSERQSFQTISTINYAREFGKHFINFSGGFELMESSLESEGYVAEGFANSKTDDPAYANGYEEGGVPSSSKEKIRSYGTFGNLNYSFNNVYLADFSYRLDGSSQFGADKKSAPFYSFGFGWNVHNHAFMKNQKVITKLKLRATYGETGSVNFAPYKAQDQFTIYRSNRYNFNVGSHVIGLGNSNLKWQNTKSKNFGVELALFRNVIDLSMNYYNKETVDMVTDIDIPLSTGFGEYTTNLGSTQNRGFEIKARAYLLRKDNVNISVFANASRNRNKLMAISDALENFNERVNNPVLDEGDETDEAKKSKASHKFTVLFKEGGSVTDIYAVRSLGVDPMTGKEVFLDKDDNVTYEWNANDKVVVGNTEPDLRGTFGSNISYKRFNVNFVFSYEYGAQAYNYTLVNKVENSDKNFNVDRRVLTDTWHNPGDEVQFVRNGVGQYSNASSRFVQDKNVLNFTSITAQYGVPTDRIKKLGLSNLKISFNMSNIKHWSTIKQERGTFYPFAHTFTLGLRANF